jgi:hypothetical protein
VKDGHEPTWRDQRFIETNTEWIMRCGAEGYARLAEQSAAAERVGQRSAQLTQAITTYTISEGQARKVVAALESDLRFSLVRLQTAEKERAAAQADFSRIADRLASARTTLAQVVPNTIAPPAPAAAPGATVTIHQRGMPSYTVPATPAPPTSMREVEDQLRTQKALDRLSE